MNNRATKDLARRYKAKGLNPAAVVYAFFYNFIVKSDSSGDSPTRISPKLEKKLLLLGPLRAIVNGFPVGCCAEARASNKVLLSYRILDVEDIRLTEAYRPRTGQRVPRCQNCRQTFY
jgi:hypothetical protein